VTHAGCQVYKREAAIKRPWRSTNLPNLGVNQSGKAPLPPYDGVARGCHTLSCIAVVRHDVPAVPIAGPSTRLREARQPVAVSFLNPSSQPKPFNKTDMASTVATCAQTTCTYQQAVETLCNPLAQRLTNPGP
jgi:hypothetical protein